jgi:23S rRNA (cytosine1962-C5)-methyltransferase
MNFWISPEQFAAFEAAQTTAHRLYASHSVWLERLGSDVLISFKTDEARDAAVAGLHEWEQRCGYRATRIFSRFLPKQNAERTAPVLLEGDPAGALTAIVTENGVRYGIDFAAGYSAGLFIDQRANRAFLRRFAPKRLLNTFAYTCSFSVAAALAGAQTVSIDLSKKSLSRGRDNFTLNELPVERHRFVAGDVLDFLPRLARRGEKFDAIVLDPPTFSRDNRGRRWQVENDLEDLLLRALELAAPNAAILISSNCSRLDRRALEAVARFSLKSLRLGGNFHQEAPLPDFPKGEGAQSLWVLLKG